MQNLAPEPVKYLIAALLAPDLPLAELRQSLEPEFGPFDFVSEPMSFDVTDYYENEMGPDLVRVFLSLEALDDPGKLAACKLKTNELETRLARPDGTRRANLDVGYLDPGKLVLASAKWGWPKVYLSDGIFGDPTLYYRKGRFLPFNWGFPDFRSGRYEAVLLKIRSLYKAQRKPPAET